MAEAASLPDPTRFRGRGAAAGVFPEADSAGLPPRSQPRRRGGAEQEPALPELAGFPPIEYPETDGKPMPDSGYQDKSYRYVVDAVHAHFGPRPEVYVAGNQFIYLEKGNKANCVAPDLFVVMNGRSGLRDSYKVWEEPGGLPEFVMEIVSPSTWTEDLRRKRARYAGLGIGEYWLYDPRGRYLDPALAGHRLVGGDYERLPHTATAAGELRMRSETLGLELRLSGGQLRFYDPDRGRHLIDHREALAKIETQEAQIRASDAALRASETGRRTAEAELCAAKAHIAKLERSGS